MNSEELIENPEYVALKKVLRALLISRSNSGISALSLANLYKENEGIQIPFAKFGFKDVLHLLHSMPDTIEIVSFT